MHGIVGGPRPPAEPGRAVVGERLLDAGLVVHHERAVLRDGLADRAALQHERLGAAGPAGERDLGVDAQDRAGGRFELLLVDAHRSLEHVQRAHRLAARRGRQAHPRAGLEHEVPDRDVGLGSRRPRVGRRRRRAQARELARDHRDLGRAAVGVGDAVTGQVLVPAAS